MTAKFLRLSICFLTIAALGPGSVSAQVEGLTGRIGQEDINYGSGLESDTFVVPSYDGGTATLTKVPDPKSDGASRIKRVWYVSASESIADHGNSGVEGTLAWVLDRVGSAPASVEFPGGHTYRFAQSFTVPENVELHLQRGAVLEVPPGVTLTVNGSIVAGPHRIFDVEGTMLLPDQVCDIQWFGTAAEAVDTIGLTSRTLSIQRAIAIPEDLSFPETITLMFEGGGSFLLSPGVTLTINGALRAGHNPIFSGDGQVSGRIKTARILPQWWGALGNGVSDDTAAIQKAVNCAARTGVTEIFFPAGEYVFTRLYLHHDPENNPGYPSDFTRRGRLRLSGVARFTHANANNDDYAGSVLRSTDPTGPAIYCDGDPLDEGTFLTNQLRFEHLSLLAENTTRVVHLESVPENSGFEDVFVGQSGSGGGILWTGLWLTHMRNVTVYGDETVPSQGPGIHLYHPAGTRAGGFVDLHNVTSAYFQKGMVFGAEDLAAGERLHSVNAVNCQASQCGTGVLIGNGIDQFNWQCSHVEGAETGVALQSNPENVSFRESSFVNCTTNCRVGSGVSEEYNRYNNILFENCQFLATNDNTGTHIKIYTSMHTWNVTLRFCKFSGNGLDTGLDLQDAIHHNLKLYDLTFNGLSVDINHPERVNVYTAENVEQRSTRTSGENALEQIPFQWKQGAVEGAVPVVEIEQNDIDVPFLNFDTPLTGPTTNFSNHLSDLNGGGGLVGPQANNGGLGGWTFKMMLRIQIKGQDYWMPIYEADVN